MAEAHGVPRGNYDGPVHDVIAMTNSVPPTPTAKGPTGPKPQMTSRNLHQSGFTLAGNIWSNVMISYCCSCILGNGTSVLVQDSTSSFQELRLMTIYPVVPHRGLWRLLVVGPVLLLCHKKVSWNSNCSAAIIQNHTSPWSKNMNVPPNRFTLVWHSNNIN